MQLSSSHDLPLSSHLPDLVTISCSDHIITSVVHRVLVLHRIYTMSMSACMRCIAFSLKVYKTLVTDVYIIL